ncbi:DUF3037 domain-containing protein [Litorilinea aerophila]|uniref:DUF3037 domain-containing protein n=1 Tax=Litorilinea aerophila TaxID=1204385 RepID=A0A540VMI0_9CHLR|nr:DUF3037 domain-containing protein [Litorilinea aerophila]MCC9074683.1 DUF3037 domain-containing protein [Litorilinea aerophila]OUC06320.1 hypothetical protein RY27_21780 [Litorilinea aerophila]GIV75860.1 MAG: hypothetical protein KatS3mg050_0254 [Litorilinea sp.]
MPTLSSYDYAFIRVVPRLERDEFLTVGVILFCRTRRFLGACIELDRARLRAMAPDLDADEVQAHLDLILRICAGEGPIGALGQAESFHWLVAPHNTVIQTSPVHCGLCHDPAQALEALMARWVRREHRPT